MPTFVKRPVHVEARQLDMMDYDGMCELVAWCAGRAVVLGIEIDTLEGTHLARDGDYITCGVSGEFYPCKPDIFALTYQAA